MTREIILELVKSKVHEGHLDWWMNSQLIAFKLKTAEEMIEAGKAQEVYDFFNWAF